MKNAHQELSRHPIGSRSSNFPLDDDGSPKNHDEVKEMVLDVWCKISRWMCGDY